MINCMWAIFENHWDLLLQKWAKRREKETKIHHSQISYENTYCPTNKTAVTIKY